MAFTMEVGVPRDCLGDLLVSCAFALDTQGFHVGLCGKSTVSHAILSTCNVMFVLAFRVQSRLNATQYEPSPGGERNGRRRQSAHAVTIVK